MTLFGIDYFTNKLIKANIYFWGKPNTPNKLRQMRRKEKSYRGSILLCLYFNKGSKDVTFVHIVIFAFVYSIYKANITVVYTIYPSQRDELSLTMIRFQLSHKTLNLTVTVKGKKQNTLGDKVCLSFAIS